VRLLKLSKEVSSVPYAAISDEYDPYKIVGSITPVGSVNNGDIKKTIDLRKQMSNLTPSSPLPNGKKFGYFLQQKLN
jgi:hypothetical protein